MVNTFGQHLLVEFRGCNPALLDDTGHIETSLTRAATEAGATVVSTTLHRFAPQGVSGVVVIEESHLSIHTWPESGYAAVDFYTCGDCTPMRAFMSLKAALQADSSEVMVVHRGRSSTDRSMTVVAHDSGPPASGRSDAPLVHGEV